MMFEIGLLTSKSLLLPLCHLPTETPHRAFKQFFFFCLLEALKICYIITNAYMISPDRSTHFYKIKGAQSAYFHKDITIRVHLVINIKDCTPNIGHSQNLHGL